MDPIMRLRINKPKVACETFEDEVVMINLENGYYYGLEKSGAEIWRLIDQNATQDEIVARLLRVYNCSREDITREVSKLVTQLSEEGLIVAREDPLSDRIQATASAGDMNSGAEKLVFPPPVLRKFTDMQDFLLVDPIHDVDDSGWPITKPE